jgi:hypothetical protein
MLQCNQCIFLEPYILLAHSMSTRALAHNTAHRFSPPSDSPSD